ncbi:glutamate--tRNA ligase family protein [Flavihumibacter cheonanensis]|uniref:glutamate--tRNA ligase family protein n=1 Tax=Flavihumibacter cheonanensis TaxID=1442385 RepID=UPI001EF8B414|nr:glutamate--tRNA ligase family protein [Flavihumibacter cheonanensis]MCG7750905.1 glutamate--tRNA ligase family protein [Flavihumibacter cheonanensis]
MNCNVLKTSLPAEKVHKTRYAPTPSGYLHLGNLYSFILTATIARNTSASILLRIDDMDRDRFRQEYLQNIFKTLRFFELPYQEGPKDEVDFLKYWSQQHRLDNYTKALDELRQKGLLYPCACTRTDLQKAGLLSGCARDCSTKLRLDDPGLNWRYRTPEQSQFLQLFTGETIAYDFPVSMKDFIVRKRDGTPAYQLCSVVDDTRFGVNLVVRGVDLLESSIAQVALSHSLDNNTYATAVHFHHPLLTDKAGYKLSKSEGAESLHTLIKSSSTPSQILTLLAQRCGINHLVSHWTDFTYSELTSIV